MYYRWEKNLLVQGEGRPVPTCKNRSLEKMRQKLSVRNGIKCRNHLPQKSHTEVVGPGRATSKESNCGLDGADLVQQTVDLGLSNEDHLQTISLS